MREFAEKFYKSKQWGKCRDAYWSKNPLCENCQKSGIVSPTEIIHHKIHLSPANIHDPRIALSESNLQALCRKCHGEAHGRAKRYHVDEVGNVTATESIDFNSCI